MVTRESTQDAMNALREYLSRNCDAWDRRRPIGEIARHLKNLTGGAWSWEKVQRLGKALLKERGIPVCTTDKRPAGMYIAASRSEMKDFWNELEVRNRGGLETQNIVMQVMNEKFPQRNLFPEKSA